MNFSFQHNGTTYTVTLESQPDGTYTAAVNGHAAQVAASQLSEGVWALTLDGTRRVTVYTAFENPHTQLVASGAAVYRLTTGDGAPRRRGSKRSGEDRLTAKMPGQVIDVLVNVGDQVVQGQTLVVLEAMKMEIRIAAPHEGTISHVFVRAGDVVEREQQLLDIQQNTDKETE